MARSQKTNEYDKWNRLLRKLKVTSDQILALPQITSYITRQLRLQRERVIELLRMSSETEVIKFLEAYDSHLIPDEARDQFPYEFYCAVSGVPPLRLLELLGGIIIRYGAQHSAIVAAIHHPEVVEATVGYALTQEGIQDRNVLHRAVGFLPTPKGVQTTINLQANAQAQASSAAVTAPPPEVTIKSLVDRFNDAKGLRNAPQLAAKNECEAAPEEIIESDLERVAVMAPAQRLAQRMYEEEKLED